MPPFNNSPFADTPMAMPGRPIWVFGSYVDTTGPTRFLVQQVRADGDDATVTGMITEGQVPDVDDHITITGLSNHQLNVRNARIQVVNIEPKSGFGTITFELPQPVTMSLANQAATAIIVRDPDDEIVVTNQASMSVSIPDSPEGHSVQGFSAEVTWPVGAVGGAVDVQVAAINVEEAFSSIGTIAYPKARFDTPAGISGNFARLMVTEVSGDGSLTGRILVR